jgi:CDP-diglyceride synthetase
MIECLIWIAICIAVAIVLIWAVETLMAAAGFSPPAALRPVLTVIAVLIVLLLILRCLSASGVIHGVP